MQNVKTPQTKNEIPREKTKAAEKRRNPREFRGSARKTQIPRFGSKFRGPRKTVGPSYLLCFELVHFHTILFLSLPLGPSIKYVTLVLGNFDSPLSSVSLCHTSRNGRNPP